MKNKKLGDKLIYPSLILAVVLFCTALIFAELWSNVSPLLPADMTAWTEGLASSVEAFFDQVGGYFDDLSGGQIPAGSSYLTPPPAGGLLAALPPEPSHA